MLILTTVLTDHFVVELAIYEEEVSEQEIKFGCLSIPVDTATNLGLLVQLRVAHTSLEKGSKHRT